MTPSAWICLSVSGNWKCPLSHVLVWFISELWNRKSRCSSVICVTFEFVCICLCDMLYNLVIISVSVHKNMSFFVLLVWSVIPYTYITTTVWQIKTKILVKDESQYGHILAYSAMLSIYVLYIVCCRWMDEYRIGTFLLIINVWV